MSRPSNYELAGHAMSSGGFLVTYAKEGITLDIRDSAGEDHTLGGDDAIECLLAVKDIQNGEMKSALDALDRHRVPAAKGLSLGDRINLLVGRMAPR